MKRENITLEKVKELLGVTDIPGTPEDLKDIVRYTENLVENYGEDWIRQNSHRLLKEWDYVLTL